MKLVPDISGRARFERELSSLINLHGIDSESDTPDFVLARYLVNCLASWADNLKAREK